MLTGTTQNVNKQARTPSKGVAHSLAPGDHVDTFTVIKYVTYFRGIPVTMETGTPKRPAAPLPWRRPC